MALVPGRTPLSPGDPQFPHDVLPAEHPRPVSEPVARFIWEHDDEVAEFKAQMGRIESQLTSVIQGLNNVVQAINTMADRLATN